MKFAINAEGKRCVPSKGGRGFCPLCGKAVRARCGNIRAHHWYHESLKECAYTNYTHVHETPWHLHWKKYFEEDWQEVILTASDGEKHISDVRTPHGLTIEFQHSPISEEERISREKFYSSVGKMIWVVDGTKSKHNWNRWNNCRLLRESSRVLTSGGMIIENAKEMLPAEWLRCSIPVFFDFLGIEPIDEAIPEKRELVCILCSKDQLKHLFIPIRHELFIALCKSGKLFQWIRSHLPKPQTPPAVSPTPTAPIIIPPQPARTSWRQPYQNRQINTNLAELLGITSRRSKHKKRNKRQSTSKKKWHR